MSALNPPSACPSHRPPGARSAHSSRLTPLPSAAAGELPASPRASAREEELYRRRDRRGLPKTAFGAEYHLAGRVDRIRKFDGPVRVFAESDRADRKAQLAKVVATTSASARSISTSPRSIPARPPTCG